MLEFTPIDIKSCMVNIRAATPFTEIYVINSKFERIMSKIGEGSTCLDSGTYTFRFQEGDIVRDVNLYVDSNLNVYDPLIKETKPSSEHVGDAVHPHTREFTNAKYIDGITFGIDVPTDNDDQGLMISPTVQLTGVSVLNIDSFLVARNANVLQLTFNVGDEVYRLPIITNASWNTVAQVESNKGIETLSVSLIDRENKRSQFENIFAKDSYFLNLSRIAMQSLVNKRSVVSKDALKFLTNRKWFLPWHGILALHLQTQKPEPDFNLIDIMVRNLERIYNGVHHPDLLAIKWWVWMQIEEAPEPATLSHPPSLSNSWKLLLQAHANNPNKVFPPFFSNKYEPTMRIKGAWLFSQNVAQSEQSQDIMRGIVRETICEYILDSGILRNHVYFDKTEQHLTLSNSVIHALNTMEPHLPNASFPIASLATMLFVPQMGTEEILEFLPKSILEVFESTGMKEKLVLATAHSIFYLQELFRPDPTSEITNREVELCL
jgi:hypothetical protein